MPCSGRVRAMAMPPVARASRSDGDVLAVQGPPGSGKTYHGARMILPCSGPVERVGITATSHKVISNLLRAVLDAADTDPAFDGVVVAAVQRGDADVVVDDPRVTRAAKTQDVADGLASGTANLAAGTAWLWASDRLAEAVDVLFIDEAGQISLANVASMANSTRQPRPVRRSAAARPAAARHASARRGPIGARPPAWGPRDDPARPRALPRAHGGCIPDLCAFTSEVFYDDRLEPEPHLASSASTTADTRFDGTGPRTVEVADGRGRQREPGRGGRGRGGRAVTGRGRRDVDDAHGRRPARRLDRRPDRRAVQRPGRRDPATAAGRGAGRDGRQVPGPGGPGQPLLADDLVAGARAARDGLPLQPEPAERGDVARARRDDRRPLARSVAGPRKDAGPDAAGERLLPPGRADRPAPRAGHRRPGHDAGVPRVEVLTLGLG